MAGPGRAPILALEDRPHSARRVGRYAQDVRSHRARFRRVKTFLGPPRTINYVWANQVPVGQTFRHPSSGRSRFIVLQSGNSRTNQWITETRDVARDWKQLFGDDDPPPIVGLGFMTDSDGTQTTVSGCYDDFILRAGK